MSFLQNILTFQVDTALAAKEIIADTLQASSTATEAPVEAAAATPSLDTMITNLQNLSLEDAVDMIVRGSLTVIGNIILALVIFYVGKWLIGKINKIISKIFEKRGLEASLSSFLSSLFKAIAYTILLITVISILGINTSSLVALFASAGLAVSMALSGTFQNFGGGVLILLLKPYRVGDFIEAQGYTGVVKEINMFSTIILTVDNKSIILPNGNMSTSIINNYTKESVRRVDWTFGVAYGEDYDQVKAVINSLLEADERILKEPATFIALSELANSSVNLAVRAWVNSSDYWDVYFDMNEKVYKEFARQNISIPFPQMDIHVVKQHESAAV